MEHYKFVVATKLRNGFCRCCLKAIDMPPPWPIAFPRVPPSPFVILACHLERIPHMVECKPPIPSIRFQAPGPKQRIILFCSPVNSRAQRVFLAAPFCIAYCRDTPALRREWSWQLYPRRGRPCWFPGHSPRPCQSRLWYPSCVYMGAKAWGRIPGR